MSLTEIEQLKILDRMVADTLPDIRLHKISSQHITDG
jgi:hypothetical protein